MYVIIELEHKIYSGNNFCVHVASFSQRISFKISNINNNPVKYDKICRIIFISNVQHLFLIASEAYCLLSLLLNITVNKSYSNNNVKQNMETLE
jgi:hypothetical protein